MNNFIKFSLIGIGVWILYEMISSNKAEAKNAEQPASLENQETIPENNIIETTAEPVFNIIKYATPGYLPLNAPAVIPANDEEKYILLTEDIINLVNDKYDFATVLQYIKGIIALESEWQNIKFSNGKIGLMGLTVEKAQKIAEICEINETINEETLLNPELNLLLGIKYFLYHSDRSGFDTATESFYFGFNPWMDGIPNFETYLLPGWRENIEQYKLTNRPDLIYSMNQTAKEYLDRVKAVIEKKRY